MPALLTCPCCNARFDLEAGLQHDAAQRAIIASMGLQPGLGEVTIRYLGLFRPAKNQLSLDRLAKLLTELVEQIRTAEVTRHGITRPAPLDYWREAMEQCVAARATLSLPLRNHHYLYEIVHAKAGKAGDKAEQAREQQLRHFANRPGGTQHVGEMLGEAPKAAPAHKSGEPARRDEAAKRRAAEAAATVRALAGGKS